jgi:hypothetical protein
MYGEINNRTVDSCAVSIVSPDFGSINTYSRLRSGTFPPLTLGLLSLPHDGPSNRSLWQPELRMLPAFALPCRQMYLLELAKLATYAASGKSQPTSSNQPESTVNPLSSWKTQATSLLHACTVLIHAFCGKLLCAVRLDFYLLMF